MSDEEIIRLVLQEEHAIVFNFGAYTRMKTWILGKLDNRGVLQGVASMTDVQARRVFTQLGLSSFPED